MTALLTAFAQGTHASRPSAASGNAGRYYYETDTHLLYQSTGSAWTLIAINTSFVASGTSHAAGLVPDPGSSAGSTKYLREDATWAVPSGGGSSYLVQTILATQSTDNSGINSNTQWTDYPNLSVSITTGGSGGDHRLWVQAAGSISPAGGGGSSVFLAIKVNTTYYPIGAA